MLKRVAVFVDAGFLFQSGGRTLLDLPVGEKPKRTHFYLDVSAFVSFARGFAEKLTASELLRIYWYDASVGRPTDFQNALAYHSFVQIRLGLINNHNQQKGVDSLLVTDMIKLAQNRAMSSAVLVSGDADMRVGVQQAQEYGVHVHLVGVGDQSKACLSNLLQQDVDSVHEWNNSQLNKFMSKRRERPGYDADSAHQLVREFYIEMSDEDLLAMQEYESQRPRVPQVLNRRLMRVAYREFRMVEEHHKHFIRKALWELYDDDSYG